MDTLEREKWATETKDQLEMTEDGDGDSHYVLKVHQSNHAGRMVRGHISAVYGGPEALRWSQRMDGSRVYSSSEADRNKFDHRDMSIIHRDSSLTTKVGGLGLNLTGESSSHMFFS